MTLADVVSRYDFYVIVFFACIGVIATVRALVRTVGRRWS